MLHPNNPQNVALKVVLVGILLAGGVPAAAQEERVAPPPTPPEFVSPVENFGTVLDTPDEPLVAALIKLERLEALRDEIAFRRSIECEVRDRQLCRRLRTSIRLIEKSIKDQERRVAAERREQASRTAHQPSSRRRTACDLESFEPDPYDPVKVINVVFHYPARRSESGNPGPGQGNFVPTHDGLGDVSFTHSRHAARWIDDANKRLAEPNQQAIGIPSPPPALPLKFRLRFTSARHVRIPPNPEELRKYYYFNNNPFNLSSSFNTPPSNPYLKLSNRQLNVVMMNRLAAPYWEFGSFALKDGSLRRDKEGNLMPEIFPHHPDAGTHYANLPFSEKDPPYAVMSDAWMSHVMRQRRYAIDLKGPPFDPPAVFKDGTWQWEAGKMSLFMGTGAYWATGGAFLHEAAHALGLHHTFVPGGTALLTDHTWLNCQDFNVGAVSGSNGNNVMDYNSIRDSWSPCQLKAVHYNLHHGLRRIRYLPCAADHDYDTKIPVDAVWDAPHELIGDLVVSANATLTLSCDVTLAKDAKVVLGPGASIVGKTFISRRPACGDPIDSNL